MFFHPFFLEDVNEVNTYIIGCSQTKQAFLIDAGGDTPEYDRYLDQMEATLAGIFLTHLHWDHDEGLESILNRHEVPVYSHTGETRNGKEIDEGQSLPLGQLKNRVLSTPGHTTNSISLVVEERIAFVGDLIFAGSVGGTSTQSLLEQEKFHIREKIFTLNDETLICGGHGPISSVKIEKEANPIMND